MDLTPWNPAWCPPLAQALVLPLFPLARALLCGPLSLSLSFSIHIYIYIYFSLSPSLPPPPSSPLSVIPLFLMCIILWCQPRVSDPFLRFTANFRPLSLRHFKPTISFSFYSFSLWRIFIDFLQKNVAEDFSFCNFMPFLLYFQSTSFYLISAF